MNPKFAFTSFVLAAALIAPSVARAGGALSPKQKFALEAAHALYGQGLRIKRSRRRVTITAKPGGLTQVRFNRYVKEVYLPALERLTINTNGRVFRFLKKPRDAKYSPQAKTKLAHLLLEPDIKYTLCQKIEDVAGIGWRQPYSFASDDRKNWCLLHALQEATSPILEYRGKKVTWSGKRERGDLRVDDVIFKKDAAGNYPIVVTVAGGRTFVSRNTYKIAQQLRHELGKEGRNNKLRAQIKRLYQRRSKAYERLVKRMVAKQWRIARHKKVLFSDKYFAEWVARKPARGTIPCASSYYVVYTPRRGGDGSYAKVLKKDGAICSVVPLDAGKRDNDSFHNSMRCGHFAAGNHKLSIDVHRRHVTGSYHKVEWRHTKFVNAKYDLSKLGKRVYGNSIRCVAK